MGANLQECRREEFQDLLFFEKCGRSFSLFGKTALFELSIPVYTFAFEWVVQIAL